MRPLISVTLLSENYVKDVSCRAEFGLALWIDTEERRILFDTGASGLFSENAAKKGIDLNAADLCVISHGHFDHTGGMLCFCRENRGAKIYIHRDAFGVTYGATGGQIDGYDCGIRWNGEELMPLRDRLVLTGGPLFLDEDAVISGTIPDVPELQPAEAFFRPDGAGGLRRDTMSHEQFLAIRQKGKGIVLFSGCSHKGIVAAARYAKRLFPGEPLYAVVAGMHLIGADNATRRRVIDCLAEEEPKLVAPIHCTGLAAICMMRERFGHRCILTGAGGTLRFD
ncbi:MAG: MBL fold metallo-hydrolase [Clostridia bacterium]|nr:MBL fold metallo-hydrolase [Clostridia bacterium]